MADSYMSTIKYNGFDSDGSGEVLIGVQDGDTVLSLVDNASALTEGGVRSMHEEDDSTDYQNTTGFNAICVLTFEASASGTEERHVRVYSGPTTNSTTGATLLWEFGTDGTSGIFDTSGQRVTTPPLKISNNHFIIVENVDDSRAGTNNILPLANRANANFVVERQE